MPPRAQRSDKGKPRGQRGGYKQAPKGLEPYADVRYLNKYQLADAAGHTFYGFQSAQRDGRVPPPEPDVRDGDGRALWDQRRKDVQNFVNTAVDAWKARNTKRLQGD